MDAMAMIIFPSSVPITMEHLDMLGAENLLDIIGCRPYCSASSEQYTHTLAASPILIVTVTVTVTLILLIVITQSWIKDNSAGRGKVF